MIVKGGAGGRGGHAGALAKHLMRTDENTRVELLEKDPAAPSENLKAILSEYQMLAATQSNGALGFYHASINPQSDDRNLSPEEWKQAVDILEKHLGFDGQSRVIVLHEKDGREHIHVIWQRYDLESGKLKSYSQNYKKHVEAAREIEQELDLHKFQDLIQDRSYDYADTQKSGRTDLSVKDRRALITNAYEATQDSGAFIAALEQVGFDLACGDKPNTFVIIDQNNEVFSLVRQITGVKKAAIHDKLLPLKPEHLKSVSDIRAVRVETAEPDLHREDIARLEIQNQFAQERLAMEAQHAIQRENMARVFEADNKAVHAKRAGIQMRQNANRKDFGKPIKKEPLRAQNIHWWKQDQTRLSRQKIAHDRLLKRQSNELAKLKREENRALRQHDQAQKSHNGLRYAQTQEDRLFQEVRHALQKIELDDRAPNSPIAIHTRRIDKLQSQQRGDERRYTTYLYHQEQSKHLFRQHFQNADTAYVNFRDYARQNGLRAAKNELLRRPEKFSEVTSEITPKALEDISASLRSIHYTEKKMFSVRLRIEENIHVETAMQEHGIEGETWRISNAARENNLHQQISAHLSAIKRAHDNPDDRRLSLMEQAQNAASKLDFETYDKFPVEDKKRLAAMKRTLVKGGVKTGHVAA